MTFSSEEIAEAFDEETTRGARYVSGPHGLVAQGLAVGWLPQGDGERRPVLTDVERKLRDREAKIRWRESLTAERRAEVRRKLREYKRRVDAANRLKRPVYAFLQPLAEVDAQGRCGRCGEAAKLRVGSRLIVPCSHSAAFFELVRIAA